MSDRKLWMLAIVGSVRYVDGDTRLQKYCLLASNGILDDESAYADWKPHHYGPYSRQLTDDVKQAVADGLIESHVVHHAPGKSHRRYMLSKEGVRILSGFKGENLGLIQKIGIRTNRYFDMSQDDLLAHTYVKFPEYASKSKIANRIDTNIAKGFGMRNSKHTVSAGDMTDIRHAAGPSARQDGFPYNDEEFREKLARQIGLESVPPIDPDAYDKLSNIFADKKFLRGVDPLEIAREVRTGSRPA